MLNAKGSTKENNLFDIDDIKDAKIPISVGAMFYRVLHENKEVCLQLLETILGFEIERIEFQNEEHTIVTGIESKDVRMDVYAKGSNKIYDIEIQNYNSPDLPKRLRYYQSAIDTSELDKGVDYDKLPETYIIFICPFDMFKKGYAKYELEVKCINDNSIDTGFGEHFIVLNTKEYGQAGSTTLCSLLKYIANGTVGSDKLTKRLDELVEQINEDKRWVSGVWKGLTWEESNRIALNSTKREWERRVKEAEAALEAGVKAAAEAAAEAKAAEAEAAKARAEAKAARVAGAKARKAEIKFTDTLLDQNRIEDLKRASKDPKFKQKLMKELGI